MSDVLNNPEDELPLDAGAHLVFGDDGVLGGGDEGPPDQPLASDPFALLDGPPAGETFADDGYLDAPGADQAQAYDDGWAADAYETGPFDSRSFDDEVWEVEGAHSRGVGASAAPGDLPPWYEDEYYDDEWGPLPARSSTFRRVLLFVGVFIVVTAAAGLAVKRWVDIRLDPAGDPTEEVIVVEIPPGASTDDVASILGDAGVVADTTVFRYWLRYKGSPQFEAGIYELRGNMAVWEARELLEGERRPLETARVTVREGLSNAELVEELVLSAIDDPRINYTEAELLDAIENAPAPGALLGAPGTFLINNEGFFFPSTYFIGEDDFADEISLINKMLTEFERQASELGLADGLVDGTNTYTAYQVLIVASLIEAEAQVPEDRAKIARVIYNRLSADPAWPLQIDATTLYAKADDGARVLSEQERTLFQSDLNDPSPWNTRRPGSIGLPPSPISAPGRASIEAALNPAEGDWFFYVLTEENGPGSHTFAVTDAEFQAAQQICRDRGLGC